MSLKNRKICVGLTGGIAAYKVPILIRMLKKAEAEVHAIMTDAAARFITELTIETVCRYPVAREMFPDRQYVATHHIDMAEWPDLFVIAPATANFLGKAASGICDDLLTTVICATEKPVAIAPSMNSSMYLNPITQKNIEYLKSVGYHFIDPGVGEMACETSGPGRLAEPEEIFKFIENFFQKTPSKKKALRGKKVIVTAGPCREAIDAVRFISNRSSGKMGYALAEAALEAGAEVTLVSGPTGLKPHPASRLINVETTEQMYRAVLREFKNGDILIMAAAPADFKSEKKLQSKLKKSENKSLNLKLVETVDILAEVGRIKKKSQKTIGFALETDHGPAHAREKLKKKNLDLIILNMVGQSSPFEGDENEVTVIGKGGRSIRIGPASKKEISRILIGHIAKLI